MADLSGACHAQHCVLITSYGLPPPMPARRAVIGDVVGEFASVATLGGADDGDAIAARQGSIGFARDGHQLSTQAELGEAAVEYIDPLPQRLVEMKLVRVDDSNSRLIA